MSKAVKINFVAVVFLMTHGLVYAQAVTWQKWYDYNNLEDNGQDAIQTFDGGYMILSNIYSPPSRRILVFKTDCLGNVEWQKLYDMNNIGGNSLNCRAITQVKDSGYIISGSNSDSAIIFKIKTDGEVEWIKRYAKLGRWGVFLDHKITNDGGIIACGFLHDPSIGYVVKTDSIGNIEWDSVYNSTTDVIRIIESKDGFFYMLGIGTTLLKTTNTGQIIWERSFFFPNKVDLIEHQSGYIFAGGGVDSMLLNKIDTSGTIVFQKGYYKGVNGCLSMCLSKDGNILLAGNDAFAFSMVVSKITPVGDLIFNKPIPTIKNPAFAFLPYAVNSTNDSGFIFTGFTNYPPNFWESNIYAAKTDSLCNAPLIVGITTNDVLIPVSFILYQNYPNPFNPETKISYSIPVSGIVKIKVYDITGREIRQLINEVKAAGTYEIKFDGSNLASGVHFYKLEANGKTIDTKRMVLIK